MTPESYRLDPAVFTAKTASSLYRLAKTKYANLSGIGAATYPGRWNQAGQEAIYSSTEMGVPVLERLAHTSKELIPTNLSMMHLALTGSWTPNIHADHTDLFDQSTGGRILLFATLDNAYRAYSQSRFFQGDTAPLAVALPSVIVPVWNVVLYPEGQSFWKHVALVALHPFSFDPRLFPESIMMEGKGKA